MHNQLSVCPDLSKNTRLISLALTGNQLTEVPALSVLTYLEILDLSNNLIIDLPGISALKNLKRIRLSHNPLTKQVLDLSNNTFLEEVDVWDTQMPGAPVLKGLTKLQTVTLDKIFSDDVNVLNSLNQINKYRRITTFWKVSKKKKDGEPLHSMVEYWKHSA